MTRDPLSYKDSARKGMHPSVIQYEAIRREDGVFHCIATTKEHDGSSLAFGRGYDAEAAKASAFGEACERYSALHRRTERTLRATLGDLPGALDPRDFRMYSDEQYDSRLRLNAAVENRLHIPPRLDPNLPMEWMQGVRLADGRPTFLPAGLCFASFHYTQGDCAYATSEFVGCASGRDRSDALANGILEVIERDAIAQWWHLKLALPMISLSALDPALIERYEASMKLQGRCLRLFDARTDVGVPVVLAMSTRSDGSEPIFGAAADLQYCGAARRALAELSQLLLCHERHLLPLRATEWIGSARIEASEHKVELEVPTADGPASPSETLAHCLRALGAVGLTPYAVDLSRSDCELRTTRVLVPELCQTVAWLGSPRLARAGKGIARQGVGWGRSGIACPF